MKEAMAYLNLIAALLKNGQWEWGDLIDDSNLMILGIILSLVSLRDFLFSTECLRIFFFFNLF
jgi:hypothetical protein